MVHCAETSSGEAQNHGRGRLKTKPPMFFLAPSWCVFPSALAVPSLIYLYPGHLYYAWGNGLFPTCRRSGSLNAKLLAQDTLPSHLLLWRPRRTQRPPRSLGRSKSFHTAYHQACVSILGAKTLASRFGCGTVLMSSFVTWFFE